jgi:recombination protein RecT
MGRQLAKRNDDAQFQLTEARRFGQVLEHAKPQIAQAFAGEDLDRFVRVTQTVVTQNPKLLQCNRDSLFLAVMDCAMFGLEPDPKVGHMDILPVWDPIKKEKVAQARPRFGGYIELARRSGEVASISPPRVVWEADHFRHGVGVDGFEFLEHEPNYKLSRDDRGEWYAIYVICNLKEQGSKPIIEVMIREDILDIRDRKSEGWRAYCEKKIKSTPWATDELEMAKKTVIRRARKYWPMSMEDKRRLRQLDMLDEAADQGRLVKATEDGEVVDLGTGEIVEYTDDVHGDDVQGPSTAGEDDGPSESDAQEARPAQGNLDQLAATAGQDDTPFDDPPESDAEPEDRGLEAEADAQNEAQVNGWLDGQLTQIAGLETEADIEDHLEGISAQLEDAAKTNKKAVDAFTRKVNKIKRTL